GIFYSTRVIPETVYLSHGVARLRVPLVPAAAAEASRRHSAKVHEADAKLQAAVDDYYAAFARGLLPQAGRYLRAALEYTHRPPRTVSMNPGDACGAAGWRSPFTGRVRVTGRLTDADPHDGAGVAWILDQVVGGGRHELSSGELPNGGSVRLAQGRHPERLDS